VFTNGTGQAASDLHVQVDLFANVSLVQNAPGCATPTISKLPPFGFLFTAADVVWPTRCVDPGESVTLQFFSDCGPPQCSGPGIQTYYWTLSGTELPCSNIDGDYWCDSADNDDDGDGYWDADETAKGSVVLNASSTPEHCDGADNDADTVLDEAPALSGRATPDPLCDPGADPDGDTILNAADPDDDNDSFTDANERYMSTDELDDCPTSSAHDAWPPDFNKSTRVDVIDALFFGSPILSGEYDRRFDLNGNGVVNIIDVLVLAPFMMQSCSNP